MDKTHSSKRVKTFLLYATITGLVIIALIAIFMIFFGTTNTLLQIMGTLVVIYLMTLLSTHNMSRLSEPHAVTRSCAIGALIFNLFWGIPWILIIWGVFGDDQFLVDTIWRLLWTALIISGYFTLLSTQLPQPATWKGVPKIQHSIPLVLVSYLMFNALIFIWISGTRDEPTLIMKLVCAELILLLLQWAIPEILIRNQHKQPTQEQNAPKFNNNQDKPAQLEDASSSSQPVDKTEASAKKEVATPKTDASGPEEK